MHMIKIPSHPAPDNERDMEVEFLEDMDVFRLWQRSADGREENDQQICFDRTQIDRLILVLMYLRSYQYDFAKDESISPEFTEWVKQFNTTFSFGRDRSNRASEI